MHLRVRSPPLVLCLLMMLLMLFIRAEASAGPICVPGSHPMSSAGWDEEIYDPNVIGTDVTLTADCTELSRPRVQATVEPSIRATFGQANVTDEAVSFGYVCSSNGSIQVAQNSSINLPRGGSGNIWTTGILSFGAPLPLELGTECEFFGCYHYTESFQGFIDGRFKRIDTGHVMNVNITSCIIDRDECGDGSAQCGQTCTDVRDGYSSSYYCSCRDGYVLNDDSHNCTDVDECVTASLNDCDHECALTVDGWYNCSCSSGYTLNQDGHTCDDVNECDINACGSLESSPECQNTAGSFGCQCPDGFNITWTEEEMNCSDINECIEDGGPCQHDCINLDGSYNCSCNHFHRLTGRHNCTVIDVCTEENIDCGDRADCENTPETIDGYTCMCDAGYERSHGSCALRGIVHVKWVVPVFLILLLFLLMGCGFTLLRKYIKDRNNLQKRYNILFKYQMKKEEVDLAYKPVDFNPMRKISYTFSLVSTLETYEYPTYPAIREIDNESEYEPGSYVSMGNLNCKEDEHAKRELSSIEEDREESVSCNKEINFSSEMGESTETKISELNLSPGYVSETGVTGTDGNVAQNFGNSVHSLNFSFEELCQQTLVDADCGDLGERKVSVSCAGYVEEEDVAGGSREYQNEEDVAGGSREYQNKEDVAGGSREYQNEEDVAGGSLEYQNEEDVVGGSRGYQNELSLLQMPVIYNVGFEMTPSASSGVYIEESDSQQAPAMLPEIEEEDEGNFTIDVHSECHDSDEPTRPDCAFDLESPDSSMDDQSTQPYSQDNINEKDVPLQEPAVDSGFSMDMMEVVPNMASFPGSHAANVHTGYIPSNSSMASSGYGSESGSSIYQSRLASTSSYVTDASTALSVYIPSNTSTASSGYVSEASVSTYKRGSSASQVGCGTPRMPQFSSIGWGSNSEYLTESSLCGSPSPLTFSRKSSDMSGYVTESQEPVYKAQGDNETSAVSISLEHSKIKVDSLTYHSNADPYVENAVTKPQNACPREKKASIVCPPPEMSGSSADVIGSSSGYEDEETPASWGYIPYPDHHSDAASASHKQSSFSEDFQLSCETDAAVLDRHSAQSFSGRHSSQSFSGRRDNGIVDISQQDHLTTSAAAAAGEDGFTCHESLPPLTSSEVYESQALPTEQSKPVALLCLPLNSSESPYINPTQLSFLHPSSSGVSVPKPGIEISMPAVSRSADSTAANLDLESLKHHHGDASSNTVAPVNGYVYLEA